MERRKFNSIRFDAERSDIPKNKLIELYETMLKIRLVELKIEELYPQDEMKTPVHLCIGQEAIPVGVCINLNRDDYVFSTHRGHGHYIAKGGDLKAMIAELYCRQTGCSKGRGGSMHLVGLLAGFYGTSSIVGGSIPIATGAALSCILQKNNRISVVFFGDAATEEGVFYESVNFAALKKLPIVFVCENNFYSVCTPLSKRQSDNNLYYRAEGFSIPGYKVDGNNVIEVYRIAKKAIENARKGNGPSLLECRTYRWRGHAGAGSDVKLGYRTQEELNKWMNKCPLKNYENLLKKNKILKEEEKSRIEKAIKREIEEAFEFARNSPLPDGSEILKYLYK